MPIEKADEVEEEIMGRRKTLGKNSKSQLFHTNHSGMGVLSDLGVVIVQLHPCSLATFPSPLDN